MLVQKADGHRSDCRYATFAALAGVDNASDTRAVALGLPDIDSYNVWPLISGEQSTSPRQELVIGDADGPPNG